MRTSILALVFAAWLGVPESAFAQRFFIIPPHGSGDKVVLVCDLPPHVRAEAREQLGCEPTVVFLYWHCFVFGEGFDLWTSNGRFVLFHNGQYWEVPREALVKMLGPGGEDSLSPPLRYRIPPGLATIVVLVGAVAVWSYFSRQARANRSLKDARYREALQVYVSHLPGDREPDDEDKQTALAAGAEFLVSGGVPRPRAEESLRLLVGELDRERSYQFRAQAQVHEMAGEWELAIAHYAEAARLREDWDPGDHAFLLKCIKRVMDKRAAAGG